PSKWPKFAYDYFVAGSAAPGALKNVWGYRTDGTNRDLIAAYNYDSHGRVITASQLDKPSRFYTYTATSVAISEASGTTTLTYDAYGRVVTVTDPAGQSTTRTYDAADRVLSITPPRPSASSPLNFVTTVSYDHY